MDNNNWPATFFGIFFMGIGFYAWIISAPNSPAGVLIFFFLFGAFFAIYPVKDKLFSASSGWLASKEREDIRKLDFEIMALENDLQFRKFDREMAEKITTVTRFLEYQPNPLFNFTIGEEKTGTYLIFEYELFDRTPSNLVGIGAIYTSQTVPTFFLLHHSLESTIYFNSKSIADLGYKVMDGDLFPKWLDASKYLCFYAGETPQEVATFLEHNRPFNYVTNGRSVRLVCFEDDKVFTFYDKTLKESIQSVNHFKRMAIRTLELSTPNPQPPNKLKQ